MHTDLIAQGRARWLKKHEEIDNDAWVNDYVPQTFPIISPSAADPMSAVNFDSKAFAHKALRTSWDLNSLPTLSDVDG